MTFSANLWLIFFINHWLHFLLLTRWNILHLNCLWPTVLALNFTLGFLASASLIYSLFSPLLSKLFFPSFPGLLASSFSDPLVLCSLWNVSLFSGRPCVFPFSCSLPFFLFYFTVLSSLTLPRLPDSSRGKNHLGQLPGPSNYFHSPLYFDHCLWILSSFLAPCLLSSPFFHFQLLSCSDLCGTWNVKFRHPIFLFL